MKKKDLIDALNAIDCEDVCIFDYKKNIHNADDEPQSFGVEPNFDVQFIKEDVNKPFIALVYDNDDYKEDGKPNNLSNIYFSIGNMMMEDDD
jgi:hypothetical protein